MPSGAPARLSALRSSALDRLIIAVLAAACLWVATAWALGWL